MFAYVCQSVAITCVLLFFPMLLCTLVEVFNSTMWKGLKDAANHSDELKSLANSLPSVVLASRASNTVDKYSGGFVRWKTWAQLHTIPTLPASPFHVSLYLRYLMQDTKTVAPLKTALYSIEWIHRLAGETSIGSPAPPCGRDHGRS